MMIQRDIDVNVPQVIIDFNPSIVAENSSFLEVIKNFNEGKNYVLVGTDFVPVLGIITLRDLIAIIASNTEWYSLQAKDIFTSLPYYSIHQLENIFNITNLFIKEGYQAIGVLDKNEKVKGIITPKSLCKYLITNSFIYDNICLEESFLSPLIELPSNLSIAAAAKIIKKDQITAIKVTNNNNVAPKIVTAHDLLSVIVNEQWELKSLQDIKNKSIPIHLHTENVATISKDFKHQDFSLVYQDVNNFYANYSLEKNELSLSIDEKNELLKKKNLAIVEPKSLLVLLTPSWQHKYLIKQNETLHRLQTAIKAEKKQVEQEKIFSELSYHIRQSLNLDEILSNTVREVRNLLQCDRVVIYKQNVDGDGLIIAESAIQGVPSLLGRIIHDHCFVQDYIQPYLDGRIQVTNNVFEANLSSCHLDLLLSIQVQANLVVPIIFHNNLWGLLAAQNCVSPRKWQPHESTLLKNLASQVAIAIQQSEYAENSQKVADYQTAIASLGNTALVTSDIDKLMTKTVEIISRTLNVKYCYLLELLPNQAAFVVKACQGWASKWENIAKIGASSRWMPGYIRQVLHPVMTEDLMIERRFSPCPFLHNQSIVSAAGVNIGGRDNLFGVIGIFSQKVRKFNFQEVNFLQTIANVLATAIERIKSQQQLDYFFHLSLDMFCIAGTDGSFKRINSSFLTTLGYSSQELLSNNLINFIHPDDKEITIAELDKLSQGFPSINFENRWLCKDGNYRWLAWKSLPYQEGIIYAVARDITMAKQAQEELRILNEQLESRVQDRTQELERTTTQLRTFVQTAGTLLIVLNQEYRILEWNEEAEKIFGWKRESVLGEDYFLLFVPPSEREDLRSYLDETIKYGKIQRNLESKIIVADGEERFLLWNINRFVDKTGEGIGVIACGQDIEEVKMAQLRLKLSEERFRSIFNQAAVGIVQVSLPGKLILFNDKFHQLLNYPPALLSELDFQELIYPDDISETLTDLSELLNGNKATFQREARFVCHDKSIIWIELTMSVVWVSVDPSYFIAVVNDISDRKKVEESLQESESRLHSILSSLQDVVWSMSLPDRKLRYINPVCEEIYGKSVQEILDNPSLIQNLAVSEDQETVKKTWENIIENSLLSIYHPKVTRNWELEYKIELPNRHIRWIRQRAYLVYDRYGRVISIDGISTDVTKRREAEDKLFDSLQEKEVLLKEIHHRVKNNLYIISGLLNLQSSYIEHEEVKNLFQDSQNRIQTMATVHEQLYQSDNLSEIDFAEYLEKLIGNLFLSYNSHQRGVKSITDLQSCHLHIETATPAGLLVNELVTNAFKHAFDDGKGFVKVSLKVDSNQQMNLIVSDNGKGLPPQLNWEESPSLGLRLVRLLIQQLDGEIEVETSNKGTLFSIKFMPPISKHKIP